MACKTAVLLSIGANPGIKLFPNSMEKISGIEPIRICFPIADRGIALVAALLVSLGIMCIVMGALYLLTISTGISGAGKRYATASEAADGAVEVMKDVISLVSAGENISSIPVVEDKSPCLVEAIIEGGQSCSVNLTLPATGILSSYKARITVARLYSLDLPGTSIDFLRSKGSAVYYRIETIVSGPANSTAETSVLYRYVH